MATEPDNTQYFSAVDSSGNSLGFSNLKDIMGKPYFAYRNPGDTATTTDMTRVATTFDPRVPQPLTASMLQNGRMPEAVSKTIKTSLGGTYSDELDHTIALELSGSNNRANLRVEPGINSPGVTPGESASFDTEEYDLARKVVTGQLSLFDAQVKLATDKKTGGDQNPIPWTPSSPAVPPSAGQPVATTQSTTVAPNQTNNPYAGITTKADSTQTQYPSLSNLVQTSIPDVQKTVANQTQKIIGSGYNPNATNNSSDQQFAAAHNVGTSRSTLKVPGTMAEYKEDYIQPLWAGGTDSADNIDKFDMPTYLKREATFSVPFTLLSYGLIDAGQARVMAQNALQNGEDTSFIPQPGATGLIPLDVAKKAQQQWAAHDADPEPVTFSSVMAGIPQAMKDWGKGILPDFVREFGKGLVGGGTAGIVPGTGPSEGENTLDKLSNFGGNLVGFFSGMGIVSKLLEGAGLFGAAAKAASTPLLEYSGTGIKALDTLTGYGKALNIASDAAKTAGIAADSVDYGLESVGGKVRGDIMTNIAKSAGLLTVWNNVIGLGGKELTGQQEFSLGNHMKQFWTDLMYAGLLGTTNQSIKGYAGVGLGSTMISLITGSNIQDALKNGALMTAMHGMGYSKDNFDAGGKMFTYKGQMNQIASDQAYKMSAVTFDQYGQPIETVKVGQGVPQVLQIDPKTIDQLKTEYKAKHPNDTRFDDLENTNSAGAIQIMSRNAREKLMDLVGKADGAISQDQVKQELTRIVTSENALTNQTLDPEARLDKQTKDLISTAAKLKPQTRSDQTRFVTDSSQVFNKVDFTNLGDYPNGKTFAVNGDFTPVGYAGNIDAQAQKTVDDMAKNPSKYRPYVVGVNDQETINFQKLVNQEIASNPSKYKKLYPNGPTGDPNDTIRLFAMERVPGGKDIPHPIGYMPKEDSYTKEESVNKYYQQITDRIQKIINRSKTPEELLKAINDDKVMKNSSGIDINRAQKLFSQKGKMTEEEIYKTLAPKGQDRPVNAQKKYSQNLNTANVADEMRKSGKNYVVADINKAWQIGGREYPGGPREHVENPFIELSFSNKNVNSNDVPFESTSRPVVDAIKKKAESVKAEAVSSAAGQAMRKAQTPEPVSTTKPVEETKSTFSKEEIKSLKKQGFTDEAIQKMAPKVKTKPLYETWNPDGSIETPEPAKPDIASRLAESASKEYPTTEEIEKAAENKRTPSVTGLVERIENKDYLNSLSGPERKTVYDNIVKEPEESRPQNNFIAKGEITSSKKTDLTDELYHDIMARVESIKPDVSSPENHEKSLMNIVNGFKGKNPGLSDKEFKNILNDAKGRATADVRDQVETAYKGTKVFGTDEDWSHKQISDNKNVLVSRYKQLDRKNAEMGLKPFEKTEMEDVKSKIQRHAQLDKETEGIKSQIADENRQPTDAETKRLQALNKERFGLTRDYVSNKDANLVFADKYGLKVTQKNGRTSLVLDKNYSPTFSDEYIKEHNLAPTDTPESVFGSFFKNDLKTWKANQAANINEWGNQIQKMSNAPNPDKSPYVDYGKRLAQSIDSALKEAYGPTYKYKWGLNYSVSPYNIERDWFSQVNDEGYAKSEPARAISAKNLAKTPAEAERNLAKAHAKTREASEQAKIDRMDAILRGEDYLREDTDEEGNTSGVGEGENDAAYVLANLGRVKDIGQLQNVSQDVTPFELMTNGIINSEYRSNLVDQYNQIRSELGGGSVKNNEKLYSQMKLLFEQVKAHSANIPEEAKTWKLGQRITLKNGGAPTEEEAVKDGFNIAMKIIKQGPKPQGSIRFDDIKSKVLGPKTETYDGGGGPGGGLDTFAHGVSDAWDNVKNFFTNTTHFVNPNVSKQGDPTTINIPRFLQAIANNETSVVDNPYNSKQKSGMTRLGQAMGKYRVTQGELTAYAPRYMGRAVTAKEFQNSPSIQDAYMTGKVKYLSNLGYTPEQIADIHNKGMTNSYPPGSTQYQNPDYVSKFDTTYLQSQALNTTP